MSRQQQQSSPGQAYIDHLQYYRNRVLVARRGANTLGDASNHSTRPSHQHDHGWKGKGGPAVRHILRVPHPQIFLLQL